MARSLSSQLSTVLRAGLCAGLCAALCAGSVLSPTAALAKGQSAPPAAAVAPSAGAVQDPSARKRIAVLPFEFSTLRRWWTGDWDLGRGIADVVVTQLVQDGAYRVIERRAIDQILGEQDFGASGRVDAKTAAKIGKVLGVDAILMGTVTQFDYESKRKGLNGIGGAIGGVIGGIGKNDTKATVIVNARLVDATSGEILATAEGKGEGRRGGFNLQAFAGRGGVNVDMGSSDFQNTILGEATRESVQQLCQLIEAAAGKVVGGKVTVKGRVADVDGKRLILNVGSENGLKAGDVLTVERVVREVKDPDTGEVLRVVTESVGSVTLTEVDGKSSVGTFSGAAAPKVGDRVAAK